MVRRKRTMFLHAPVHGDGRGVGRRVQRSR
jgi:hypothetical protein